jgi:hypothetical protein
MLERRGKRVLPYPIHYLSPLYKHHRLASIFYILLLPFSCSSKLLTLHQHRDKEEEEEEEEEELE